MEAALAVVDGIEGWLALDEAALLYALAREVTDGCIVEVGSYRGRSTTALALGSAAGHDLPVYAVEPHEPFTGPLGGEFGPEDRAAFYRTMLDAGCYERVRLVNLSSEVVAPGWRLPVGLLWIDGDHRYEGVSRDATVWAPHVVSGGAVVFDDATDEAIGPYRVVQKLLASGDYDDVGTVGKVRVLRRR